MKGKIGKSIFFACVLTLITGTTNAFAIDSVLYDSLYGWDLYGATDMDETAYYAAGTHVTRAEPKPEGVYVRIDNVQVSAYLRLESNGELIDSDFGGDLDDGKRDRFIKVYTGRETKYDAYAKSYHYVKSGNTVKDGWSINYGEY